MNSLKVYNIHVYVGVDAGIWWEGGRCLKAQHLRQYNTNGLSTPRVQSLTACGPEASLSIPGDVRREALGA